MPDWSIPVMQTVLGAAFVGVLYAVPKIWADTRQNIRDIQEHERKFAVLFNKIDQVATDTAYIRGRLDHDE